MDTQQPTVRTADYEQALINIVQTLPSERAEQIVDFARFIQFLELSERGVLHEDETEEEVRADNERWEATFSASRGRLRALAREAREEIQAGQTTEMKFTDEGEIAPG